MFDNNNQPTTDHQSEPNLIESMNQRMNKRKNFRPRCLIDSLNDHHQQQSQSSTSTIMNRIAIESASNEEQGSPLTLYHQQQQQQQWLQNILMNTTIPTTTTTTNNDQSSSLIMNSFITKMLNDMNTIDSQTQMQQLPPQQSSAAAKPLDLSDQPQQQQPQQQFLFEQITNQQQQQQSKNSLFELFLLKSLQNQLESIGSNSEAPQAIALAPEAAPMKSKKLRSQSDSQQQQQAAIDSLLHLYNFNRENYLKYLQQQQQTSISPSASSILFPPSTPTITSDNAKRQSAKLSKKSLKLLSSLHHRNQSQLAAGNFDTNHQQHHQSSRTNFTKLKQLQHQFYRSANLGTPNGGVIGTGDNSPHQRCTPTIGFDLLNFNEFFTTNQQQQWQQPKSKQSKSSPYSNNDTTTTTMAMYNNGNTNDVDDQDDDNIDDNLSSSPSSATMNNNKSDAKIDNITYVKDLFRNKVMNVKSSSRRPLSSWKQTINACGPGPAPWIDKSTLYSLGIQSELIQKSCTIDYSKYVKRYANSNECGNNQCMELSYREHFHCETASCNSRVFMKKEEMIRHFKWHKKRDESLTQGFLRCSPNDNCVDRFPRCPHHRKQTHYHCLKLGCDKAYISTSDVQMHANYHRKDTAIIQEGFQRFRANENCLLESCQFYGLKTTHFHCCRDNCLHTFKNKADMEKHKSFHVRDEQLARDGFKKYSKNESCPYDDCPSSGVYNHIHCNRSGCTQALHSTQQLYPHKRNHDRCEKQLAYRKYRLAQSIHQRQRQQRLSSGNEPKTKIQIRLESYDIDLMAVGGVDDSICKNIDESLIRNEDKINQLFDDLIQNDQISTLSTISLISIEDIIGIDEDDDDDADTAAAEDRNISKYIQRHQKSNKQCTFIDDDDDDDDDDENEDFDGGGGTGGGNIGNGEDGLNNNNKSNESSHYNCSDCNVCFNNHRKMVKHARKHLIQDQIISLIYDEYDNVDDGSDHGPNQCPNESCTLAHRPHLHCRMFGCTFAIESTDNTLKKFDHYKFHEDLQCNYSFDSDESVFSNLNGYLSMDNNNQSQPPLPSSTTTPTCSTPTSLSSQPTPPPPPQPPLPSLPQPQASKSTDNSLLTLGENMPVLKKKRGRPPKIRFDDQSPCASTSSKKLSQKTPKAAVASTDMSPVATNQSNPLTGMSSFDLTKAFNLPLNQIQMLANLSKNMVNNDEDNDDDNNRSTNKTIPIPFIMPYIKSSEHDGFYVFDSETICPDLTCVYLRQKHYHCSKPRCFYATNLEQNLDEHSNDFHNNIDILESFVYYDKSVDCKSNNDDCEFNNRKQSHFHCTRFGCYYSFDNYSLMIVHDNKHNQRKRLNNNQLKSSTMNNENDHDQSTNDTDDDEDIENDRNDPKNNYEDGPKDDVKDDSIDRKAVEDTNGAENAANQEEQDPSTAPTSSILLQQSLQSIFQSKMNHSLPISTSTAANNIKEDDIIRMHPIYDEQSDQSCNSPFCKLKKRKHLHCNICNQAFTSYDRLLPHYTKHTMIINSSLSSRKESSKIKSENVESNESIGQQQPLKLTTAHPLSLTNEFFQLFLSNLMNMPPQTLPSTATVDSVANSAKLLPESNGKNAVNNNMKRKHSFSSDSSGSLIINDTDNCKNNNSNEVNSKKHKIVNENDSNINQGDSNNNKSTAVTPILMDQESSPLGYLRFRFNEDCHFQSCVYREHQTHFHCMRKDCGYSFCDKTRFVQHTARHERLDTLMGGDFRQYRASVDCGESDCRYSLTNSNNNTNTNQNNNNNNAKLSHFHCLKCKYRCSDTNKVVAHRRQHYKMDNIMAAGFIKYSPNDDCCCHREDQQCNFKYRQTHYHCIKCNYSLLGLSQMLIHKQQKHQHDDDDDNSVVAPATSVDASQSAASSSLSVSSSASISSAIQQQP